MWIANHKSCVIAAKSPAMVHLDGRTYVGYDLTQIGGSSQPILAEKEHMQLHFRTAQDSGLLLYSGNLSFSLLASVVITFHADFRFCVVDYYNYLNNLKKNIFTI